MYCIGNTNIDIPRADRSASTGFCGPDPTCRRRRSRPACKTYSVRKAFNNHQSYGLPTKCHDPVRITRIPVRERRASVQSSYRSLSALANRNHLQAYINQVSRAHSVVHYPTNGGRFFPGVGSQTAYKSAQAPSLDAIAPWPAQRRIQLRPVRLIRLCDVRKIWTVGQLKISFISETRAN